MRYNFIISITLLIVSLFCSELLAQRQYSYEELRQRQFVSPAFISVFPGVTDSDGNANVSSVFKIRHDQLDFRSVRAADREHEDERFASRLRIDFEVYQRDEDGERTGSPVSRNSWNKRVSATDYEATRSRNKFIEAAQSFLIDPGNYVLRANVYSNDRRIGAFTRRFDFADKPEDNNWVMLTQSDEESGRPRLINMANNSHYGQELKTWFILPQADADYRIQVDRLRIQNGDTTKTETVYDENLASEKIFTDRRIQIITENNKPLLKFDGEGLYTLAGLELPNETYQNRHYRMRIYNEDDESETAITDYTWYNLWVDMPVSLLNVDFAIRRLENIVDNSKLNELQRGNRQQREERFLEFWKERDPEPETTFNIVMAEYYRRVDEAYDKFTTLNQQGFESDQGKIYITRGEPNDIRRRYPTSGPTQEIWEYDDKTYIFEATTGFGDYRLVEER